MEEWINKLNAEYKTSSERSVISFSFSDEEKLIGYQLDMLKNNRIPCFLSCEVLRIDGEIRIQYDITSLLSLNKVLERKHISRSDFVAFASQIIQAFSAMECYLLDFGGILLDSRFIYCSPNENKFYLIFIPEKDMPQSVHESLKKLFLNLVVQEMTFTNEVTDNYIQRLIEALKSPDFGLETLKAYVDGLKNAGVSHSAQNAIQNVESKPATSAYQPSASHSAPNGSPQPAKTAISHTPSTSFTPSNGLTSAAGLSQPSIPGLKPSSSVHQNKTKVVQQTVSQPTSQTVKVFPIKSYIIFGSELVCLALLFLALFLKGSLNPDNPDMLTTLVGMLLIGGALTYLVWSKVFTPEKKVEKVIVKNAKIPVHGNSVLQKESIQPSVHQVTYVNKSIRQPEISVVDRRQVIANQPVQSQKTYDKTVLLSEKNITTPVLKKLGHNPETIPIHKWPFMIGRLSEQTDYCMMNPAIGKLHAELISRAEGYFITDMNTRNGTFVNGNRVEASKEYCIKNGDKIMLANEEFIFCA